MFSKDTAELRRAVLYWTKRYEEIDTEVQSPDNRNFIYLVNERDRVYKILENAKEMLKKAQQDNK